MDVSEKTIDCLVDHSIDTVFGIPGKQSLPLNKAIDGREDIEFVVARHETAVSHEAWGYAETSGQMAATVVVPGPGDMNAMNGLKNALNDCVPLIHFAIETEPHLRGGDAIHETPPDTYNNVVKENILVETPQATVAEVERAINIAQTHPKGPVRVGIPKNYLTMDVSLGRCQLQTEQIPHDIPESIINAAARSLAGSNSPIILAGGGVRASSASKELQSVAAHLGAPIITTYKGKGTVPEDYRLTAGVLGGSACPELLDCLKGSDIALVVGSDLDAHCTRGWSIELPDSIIHVTLDADALGKGYDPTFAIVADAKEVLTSLDNRLNGLDVMTSDGVQRVAAIQEAMDKRLEPLLTQKPPFTSVQALKLIGEVLPEEAIVTVDAGGFRVWALNVLNAYGPRRYVQPGSWATMGTGVPSAIGAQYANPTAPIVALTGDGGLMMCIQELHTAAANALPLTIVVFNNDDYAIISDEGRRKFDLDQQEYGWQNFPIDFVKIAEGMGMKATYADTPQDIHESIQSGLQSDSPTLVEIPTDPMEPQAGEFMRR